MAGITNTYRPSLQVAELPRTELPVADLDLIRIPIKSRVVCGFNPTGRRRNKYVFREMDVYPAGFWIYGNWAEVRMKDLKGGSLNPVLEAVL